MRNDWAEGHAGHHTVKLEPIFQAVLGTSHLMRVFVGCPGTGLQKKQWAKNCPLAPRAVPRPHKPSLGPSSTPVPKLHLGTEQQINGSWRAEFFPPHHSRPGRNLHRARVTLIHKLLQPYMNLSAPSCPACAQVGPASALGQAPSNVSLAPPDPIISGPDPAC